MIDAYANEARSTGARIVFSCGFDSVPFELGVLFLQNAAKKTWGDVADHVKGRVRVRKGTFSGGTAASSRATLASAMGSQQVLAQTESFFSSLKKERIRKRIYKTRDLARADVFDYIEVFYNRTRRHSQTPNPTPIESQGLLAYWTSHCTFAKLGRICQGSGV